MARGSGLGDVDDVLGVGREFDDIVGVDDVVGDGASVAVDVPVSAVGERDADDVRSVVVVRAVADVAADSVAVARRVRASEGQSSILSSKIDGCAEVVGGDGLAHDSLSRSAFPPDVLTLRHGTDM